MYIKLNRSLNLTPGGKPPTKMRSLNSMPIRGMDSTDVSAAADGGGRAPANEVHEMVDAERDSAESSDETLVELPIAAVVLPMLLLFL